MRARWLGLLTLACLPLPIPATHSPATGVAARGNVTSNAAWLATTRGEPDATTRHRVSDRYGRLPLSFEKNEGQTDSRVAFLSRGSRYTLFLLHEGGEAVITLSGATRADGESPRAARNGGRDVRRAAALRLKPIGAQPSRAEAHQPLPGEVNYLRGADGARWRTGISTYARVAYPNIYSGVDLVYYGNQRRLEYDFVVRPGADPGAIMLEVEGAERIEVDARGDLVLHVGTDAIRQHRPIVYQNVDGVRHEREGRYALQGSNRVTFQLGAFDPTIPLVIDPVLEYSTFLGGVHYLGEGADDAAHDVAVDADGHAYVTGFTRSVDFPATPDAFDTTFNDVQERDGDVFITKLNPDGATLAYSTFVGGRGEDTGWSISVDSAGHAYVAGSTASRDFPTTAGSFDRSSSGGDDAFVLKLDAAGAVLTFSTFLGGSQDDVAKSIAVDGSGQTYVAGVTNSADFPATAGAYDVTLNGPDPLGRDAFVTKLDASGATLIYSTFLGGTESEEQDIGVAVDGSGRAYVTGGTRSSDFPTTPGSYDVSYNGGDRDVFITRLDAAGAALSYSTFLGGIGPDDGVGIAVDSDGNAYVAGRTGSDEFPTTTGAYDTSRNGDWDIFVAKLDTTGATLAYSTYVGGRISDHANGIAVDAAGRAHVVGLTGGDFPTTAGAYDTTYNLRDDVFVLMLSAGGSTLLYATYLGGDGFDRGSGLAIDPAGNTYIAGFTRSGDYPTTPGAYDATRNGGDEAFVTKLNAAGSAPLVYSTYIGGNLQVGGSTSGWGLAVDEAGSAYVAGTTSATDFPATSGAYDVNWNGGSNDVFVTKLSPSGDTLVYSTFLGSSGADSVAGIAVDGGGHAFVAGRTTSADFPTTSGAYDTSFNGGQDVFLTKLGPSGATLTYSTFLGGAGYDDTYGGVAIDASGQAYVTGHTGSIDFPTTAGAYDTSHNGAEDVFVTKVNAAGTMLVYSTLVGGAGPDVANAIAIDAAGSAYVAGYSQYLTFPTTPGSYDTTHNGGADAFVTKVDATGTTLAYSTFLGGASRDSAQGIAVDAAGNAHVTGMTASAGFPTTAGAYATNLTGTTDVFVAKLDAAGTTLVYSTLLGGSALESGTAVAIDTSGTAYVTGVTVSSDFPTTSGALDVSWNLGQDAFVAQLDSAGAALLYSTFLGGIGADQAYGLALDTEGNVYVAGGTGSSNTFPTTIGAYDTSPNGLTDAFVAKFNDVGPSRPRIIITANGTFGPLTLTSGDPLAIDVSFDPAGSGTIDPAEVYVGVYTPQGVFWLDTTSQRFLPTPRPVYTGTLANFGPLRVVSLANAATLALGPYIWFMAVDHDSNGQPDFTFFDSVLTVVE